jgi:transcriptional regulator with PAS, ATPase and Fis domain
MKTKLTFLSLALLALLGAGMLMAFKQEEKHKQYLTASFVFGKKQVVIVDEEGKITEYNFNNTLSYSKETSLLLTKEINSISSKGYKLVDALSPEIGGYSTIQYIFEKE